MNLYPLSFKPIYAKRVWGGHLLECFLGDEVEDEPIGEAWIISNHKNGMSYVSNGEYKGKSLAELIDEFGEKLLGKKIHDKYGKNFPLLIKYIYAKDSLSVQVHPNDEYAYEHEGEAGKTEMWYILDAEEEATLIAGLEKGVTKEIFKESLSSGDPALLLAKSEVKKGDSIFIPAGRVHAIQAGLLILEIQQNSDTTYRMYDWGRVGLDGEPRELHIEKSLEVTDWMDFNPKIKDADDPNHILANCEYFTVEKMNIKDEVTVNTDDAFVIINVVEGNLIINREDEVTEGQSRLIPAAKKSFKLESKDASVVISRPK